MNKKRKELDATCEALGFSGVRRDILFRTLDKLKKHKLQLLFSMIDDKHLLIVDGKYLLTI